MALSNGPNLGLLVNAAQGEAHFAEQQRLLRGLDALVQPSVKDKDLATPPGSPADGDRYIVAAAPIGAWVGHAAEIARWSSVATAWEFYVPKAGWRMYLEDEQVVYTYTGAAWIPPFIVDTAGEGGFWGGVVNRAGRLETVGASSGANLVKVYQFILPFQAVAGKIVFEVTTLSVGAFASVGIYSADGNSLLVHTGAVSTTLAEIKNITLGSSVRFEPAVYLFAHTHSDATARLRGFNTSLGTAAMLNENANRMGDGANASVAGVLPATVGTITPWPRNVAAAYFEP